MGEALGLFWTLGSAPRALRSGLEPRSLRFCWTCFLVTVCAAGMFHANLAQAEGMGHDMCSVMFSNPLDCLCSVTSSVVLLGFVTSSVVLLGMQVPHRNVPRQPDAIRGHGARHVLVSGRGPDAVHVRQALGGEAAGAVGQADQVEGA
eukprot:scaffold13664_cov89-Isochrysis_galbana.AAC.1